MNVPPISSTPSQHKGPRPLQLSLSSPASPSTSTPSPLSSQAGPARTIPSPLSLSHSNHTVSKPGPPSSYRVHSPPARLVHNVRTGTPRRQSSISYISPQASALGDDNYGLYNLERPGLVRSKSVGNKAVKPPTIDRRSSASATTTGDSGQAQTERAPLTLAEKHSDLLHFIAQKESKCLELRSQLAGHEAELLQLKRKWERIVNRGFERSNGIALSDSTPSSSSVNDAVPGVALFGIEGIRGGVQGVGRFIAAGLGELSAAAQAGPPSPSSSPSPSPASHLPSPAASPASTKVLHKRLLSHTTQSSNSSVSTHSTVTSKSTRSRLSQSSASSIGEEPELEEFGKFEENIEGQVSAKSSEQDFLTLMVKDTGATPTMSPNPVFARKHSSGPSESSFDFGTGEDFGAFVSGPTKMHRRNSGSAPCRSKALDLTTVTSKKDELPPLAGAPGLSSLAVAAGLVNGSEADGGVSSWVGSVGKKWGEIQKGSTFMKHQKRASSLLAQTADSIASALSPPPLASASFSPTLASFHEHNFYSISTSASESGNVSNSSVSLLDTDDDAWGDLSKNDTTVRASLPGMGVMKPDAKGVPIPAPTSVAATVDDDEEWGW